MLPPSAMGCLHTCNRPQSKGTAFEMLILILTLKVCKFCIIYYPSLLLLLTHTDILTFCEFCACISISNANRLFRPLLEPGESNFTTLLRCVMQLLREWIARCLAPDADASFVIFFSLYRCKKKPIHRLHADGRERCERLYDFLLEDFRLTCGDGVPPDRPRQEGSALLWRAQEQDRILHTAHTPRRSRYRGHICRNRIPPQSGYR